MNGGIFKGALTAHGFQGVPIGIGKFIIQGTGNSFKGHHTTSDVLCGIGTEVQEFVVEEGSERAFQNGIKIGHEDFTFGGIGGICQDNLGNIVIPDIVTTGILNIGLGAECQS